LVAVNSLWPGLQCLVPEKSFVIITFGIGITKVEAVGQSEPAPMTAPVGRSIHRMG
jgi:hypothetical protein